MHIGNSLTLAVYSQVLHLQVRKAAHDPKMVHVVGHSVWKFSHNYLPH